MNLSQYLTEGLERSTTQISGRKVGRILGINREMVRLYLTGSAVPEPTILKRLCKLLELDPSMAESLAEKDRKEIAMARRSINDQEFRTLAALWQLLSTEQRRSVMAYAVAMFRPEMRTDNLKKAS